MALNITLNGTEDNYGQINRVNFGNLDIFSKVLILFVLLYVLVSNSLLIYGLLKSGDRQKKLSISKKLFLYLSVNDILASFCAVLNDTVYLLNPPRYLSGLVVFLAHGSYFTGYMLFLAISIFRFISLKYPFKRISKCTICSGLSIGILIGTVNGVLQFFLVYKPSKKLRHFVSVFWFLGYFGQTIPLISMSILSFHYLNKHHIKTEGKTPTCAQSDCKVITNGHIERKKYAVKTLSYITLSYVFCNMPILFIILRQARFIVSSDAKVNAILTQLPGILYSIALANIGNNATIYILRSNELRTFYRKKILSCKSKCSTRSKMSNC